MPLSDLQIALGMMVTRQSAKRRHGDLSNFDKLRLTETERDWLERLLDTPGFNVTCHIQRWWRETKLNWTTRLTLAALGSEHADAAIKDYLDVTPCSSLFFTPEALGFLDHVADMVNQKGLAELSHLAEIVRFERALLIAKEAAQQSVDPWYSENEIHSYARLSPHPAAAIVEFAAPPAELLGALVGGHSLPPPSSTRFPVLVAPGLAYYWRPASADESRMFARCQSAPSVEDLRASHPDPDLSLQRLLSAGALRFIVGKCR